MVLPAVLLGTRSQRVLVFTGIESPTPDESGQVATGERLLASRSQTSNASVNVGRV